MNRTYGTHKNLPGTDFAIFTENIWSYLLCSPVILIPGSSYQDQTGVVKTLAYKYIYWRFFCL